LIPLRWNMFLGYALDLCFYISLRALWFCIIDILSNKIFLPPWSLFCMCCISSFTTSIVVLLSNLLILPLSNVECQCWRGSPGEHRSHASTYKTYIITQFQFYFLRCHNHWLHYIAGGAVSEDRDYYWYIISYLCCYGARCSPAVK
jgi:hypothetical protein